MEVIPHTLDQNATARMVPVHLRTPTPRRCLQDHDTLILPPNQGCCLLTVAWKHAHTHCHWKFIHSSTRTKAEITYTLRASASLEHRPALTSQKMLEAWPEIKRSGYWLLRTKVPRNVSHHRPGQLFSSLKATSPNRKSRRQCAWRVFSKDALSIQWCAKSR